VWVIAGFCVASASSALALVIASDIRGRIRAFFGA
jgi:hypothetical protein